MATHSTVASPTTPAQAADSAMKGRPGKATTAKDSLALWEKILTPAKGTKKADKLVVVTDFVDGLVGTPAVCEEMEIFKLLGEALVVQGKTGKNTREGALLVVAQLVERLGARVEADAVGIFSRTLDLLGDKMKPVREAAAPAAQAIFDNTNAHGVRLLLTQLMIKCNGWQPNQARLDYIATLCEKSKPQMMTALPEIIPAVALDIHDINSEVGEAAKRTILALGTCCTNVDVLPLMPTLVSALQEPERLTECVNKLASCTFVEIVDSATLSIICPILNSGFRSQNNKLKRSCARIVDNMTTLVEDSRDVQPFVEQLLPLMESARENIPNPEFREVCAKACTTLSEKVALEPAFKFVTVEEVLPVIQKAAGKAGEAPAALTALTYVAELMSVINLTNEAHLEVVQKNVSPYLAFADEKTAAAIVTALMTMARDPNANQIEEVEENAEELCNCDFSLAYGNKVLLKKTRLRLHRGLRYGLIGKNDSGKTSLMRAIAEYRVDGFPDASELRTIFVETDIKAEFADMNIVDFMFADPLLASLKLSRDAIIKTLEDMGFHEDAPASVNHTCGSLSGGWRMKLALSRAMLLNADILLLDEPTNHLDAYNVKWVEDYLMSLDRVTSIMVSHDSGLLDRVCTNMIQIDAYKLNFYKGNLSEFVARFPKARAYFELVSTKVKFSFPQPGILQGISSKGKPIMKMNDISFTYPGAKKAQLNNVTVQISLGSRVACVGVNGAGKSTMIKLLTGELEPDKGSGNVWTHPNCRVGYIAQHAFHHIDKYLHKSANEYVRDRYNNGNDREEQQKVTNTVNEEDLKNMAKSILVSVKDLETGLSHKVPVVVGRLTEGRRTNKAMQDQEYECQALGKDTCYWILRKQLVKGGWEKVLATTDQRIATRAAMYAKPLTTGNVIKHFEDVGLEEEFSTHVPMASLSGGQKVKVVLGAAMWNKPHVVILDEPTNYLDRESLGALAQAIREFEGGVVMITHNSQFCDNLCPTVWHLQNNTLDVKGDAEWMQQMKEQEVKEEKIDKDAMVDKFGNTIELKVNKDNMSNKEKKKRDKARAKLNRARKKQGLEPIEYFSDEDLNDM